MIERIHTTKVSFAVDSYISGLLGPYVCKDTLRPIRTTPGVYTTPPLLPVSGIRLAPIKISKGTSL